MQIQYLWSPFPAQLTTISWCKPSKKHNLTKSKEKYGLSFENVITRIILINVKPQTTSPSLSKHRFHPLSSISCINSWTLRVTQFYDKMKSESCLPWIVLCLGLCPHFLPTGWRSAQAESGIAELSQNLIIEPKSIYALRLVKLGCQELHSYLEGPK